MSDRASEFTISSITIGSALPAGDNNIGNVDIVTVPTDPFGANADAASATGSISAKLRFIAAIGIPITSIAAGTNNIGDVDVLTVPSDPFGVNADAASATGSISAKLRFIASTGIPITGDALTALQNIDTDMTTVIGHVDGIEGLLTTIDADTGSILTAVQIMDDWDNGASDGVSVSGDVAHDTGDAGEPIKIGGKGLTSPVAVTANDRVNAQFDIWGRQITSTGLREMKNSQITTITSSTSETTIVTADATYKKDLYGLIVVNTSATATEISVKDSTAGTTRFWISIPANDMAGFMLPMDAAHKQNAANNNWTATCADSVASVIITALTINNL